MGRVLEGALPDFFLSGAVLFQILWSLYKATTLTEGSPDLQLSLVLLTN